MPQVNVVVSGTKLVCHVTLARCLQVDKGYYNGKRLRLSLILRERDGSTMQRCCSTHCGMFRHRPPVTFGHSFVTIAPRHSWRLELYHHH